MTKRGQRRLAAAALLALLYTREPINQRQEEGLARISDALAAACIIGAVVGTFGPGGGLLSTWQIVLLEAAAIGLALIGLELRGDET
jgi:hypothetical protein